MQKVMKHFTGQPFILATGLAALIHSTWSLGTFFSGEMIPLEQLTDFFKWIQFLNWLIPALLIAFALDVGQISTSHEIREYGVTLGRATTFFVFAIATYYLQFLYMAHHMPALELSSGLRAFPAAALFIRDMAVWFIPALLPLSTVLYTLSGDDKNSRIEQNEAYMSNMNAVSVINDSIDVLPDVTRIALPDTPLPLGFNLACPDCDDWETGERDTLEEAENSLRGHRNKVHSKASQMTQPEPVEMSANGNH